MNEERNLCPGCTYPTERYVTASEHDGVWWHDACWRDRFAPKASSQEMAGASNRHERRRAAKWERVR